MSRRDPRSVRIRGVGCGHAGTVVQSIDVDGLHGAAGPPLLVLVSADEARLTADLLRDYAGRRGSRRRSPAPFRVIDSEADAQAAALEAGVLAVEGWGRAIGRHLRGLLGFRSAGGAAEPRAPP